MSGTNTGPETSLEALFTVKGRTLEREKKRTLGFGIEFWASIFSSSSLDQHMKPLKRQVETS